MSSFKESQSTEEDEVGNNTQDTASENQDSFEETPQVSASQTSTEQNTAPPLSGKRKRLQDLSEAMSGLRQVNQTLLQVMEEDEFDAFGRSLALGLKKLPLNLAVQCQNALQATLSRYRSRGICELSVPSKYLELQKHPCIVIIFCNKVCRLLLTLQPRARMLEKKILLLVIETFANNFNVQISCM